ncbi:S-layer homology domain-containing protein [Sporomusa termitida]|uniref:S-layer homology domain protein n=1 Tax=Sporomusa termitida TaxID=2377 RepID=A0A517DPM6_9FIRM|nr:S-layer homology domain-containing protein [Sporomusa termitida]QDR79311.1 S-layer homology domain protein [Sporomusa termitida]
MKKSIILLIAILLVLSMAGSAVAANDFSDVAANHWAYDAVNQLQQAGLVDGYSDGAFRGDKALTRYEFAVVIARGLENYTKANNHQQGLLNKLSAEFAAELNNIGVRLNKLEKNQPNLKFSGIAEVRYTSQDNNGTVPSSVGGAYRVRLNGVAKVDANTSLGLRLASGTTKSGTKYKYSSGTFTSFGSNAAADDNKNNVTLDRIFLTSTIGAVQTTVGAQELKLGTTGFIVDSGGISFDGIKFATAVGAVKLVGNWGRQQKNGSAGTTIDVASLEAAAKQGKLNYGTGYATLKDRGNVHTTLAEYLHGNAKYRFDDGFSLGGEYVYNQQADSDKTAWTAIATIGNQEIVAKGQNNIVVKYYHVDKNSISRLTSYSLQSKAGAGITEAFSDVRNLKGLNVAYNYGFSKNLRAYVAYQKLTDKEAAAGDDRGYQYYRAAVVANF